jgi:hypothetical protein
MTTAPATFLVGYGGKRYTLDAASALPTVANMEPETKRRVLALVLDAGAAGVDLGIGTAWRSLAQQEATFFARTTPDSAGSLVYKGQRYRLLPGMAPIAVPGNSWHELGAAVDFLNYTAPITWAEANCAAYGLRSFAHLSSGAERWHFQRQDLTTARNRVASVPPPAYVWKLPNAASNPPAYTDWPTMVTNTAKPLVQLGARGPAVTYMQEVLTACGAQPGPIDGNAGTVTITCLIAFQRYVGLEADGRCGRLTWAVLDAWVRYFLGIGAKP